MSDVLVIDDAEDVRFLIISTLSHFGFSGRGAEDGEAGIRLALEQPPDLIICDVRMPHMDGYRTLAKIRELPGIANIPFIFLTAAAEKQDMRRGMLSGADDYLTKPFTPDELLEAVATRLSRQADLKTEIFLRAGKLQDDVVRLLSQELTRPLDGIIGLTSDMMKEYSHIPPERVLVNARQINDSAVRLNELAKTLV